MGAINEKIEIDNTDGRVILYKRPKEQSLRRFWYVRARKEDGKYIHKSTKTTSKEKAYSLAVKLYHDLLYAEQKGVKYIPKGKRTFEFFVNDFMSQGFSDYRRTHIEGIFRRYLVPYFSGKEIEKINQAEFNGYIEYRKNIWLGISDTEARARRINKTPSKSVIKAELQVLRQYLIWCANQGYATYVHHFSIEKNSNLFDTRRRSKVIPNDHLERIRRTLRKRALYPFVMAGKDLGKSRFDVTIEEAHKAMLSLSEGGITSKINVDGLNGDLTAVPVHYHYRLMMYYFTQIVYHSLTRPSREIAQLTWSNVSIRDVRVEGIKQKQAFLIIPLGKKGGSRECLLTGGGTISLIRYRHFSKMFGYGDLNDWVFPDPRSNNHMSASAIGNAFSKVLETEDLKIDWAGRNVTLYSYCRTNAIARALSHYGLSDVSTLANVSLMTLDRFYKENLGMMSPEKFFTRSDKQKAIGFKDKTFEAEYLFKDDDWS